MLAGKIAYFRATAHPEAADWRSRVIANGGTVSASTFAAVESFCRSIDAAGLRSLFYRLNLFCGSNLSACLVPLYRGQSLGGTQFGNATDTNFNFVAADYAETGVTGGLKGNASNKYLQTGFAPQSLTTPGLAHMSMSGTSLETTGLNFAATATYDGTNSSSYYGLEIRNASGTSRACFAGSFAPTLAYSGPVESHLVYSRTTSTRADSYQNGLAFASDTAASGGAAAASSRQFYVFALNNNGTPQRYTAGRFRMYSLGDPMTAAQVSAFTNAVVAFNTALSRE